MLEVDSEEPQAVILVPITSIEEKIRAFLEKVMRVLAKLDLPGLTHWKAFMRTS